jgi:hypothetical protein
MDDTYTMSQDAMVDSQPEPERDSALLRQDVCRKLARLRSTMHEFEDAVGDAVTDEALIYAEGVLDRALDAFLEF